MKPVIIVEVERGVIRVVIIFGDWKRVEIRYIEARKKKGKVKRLFVIISRFSRTIFNVVKNKSNRVVATSRAILLYS